MTSFLGLLAPFCLMKNRRWNIYFTKEFKYNYYKDVDKNKWRPLFVWKSYLPTIKNHWLCFYCSSKIDKNNKNLCIFIDKNKNKGFSKNTYIWLHKPIIFFKYDFIIFRKLNNKRPQCSIDDKKLRNEIRTKIEEIYSWNFK